MVLPAPEQGSVDHLVQGRRYGTAAKLQRLEKEGHVESVQMLIKELTVVSEKLGVLKYSVENQRGFDPPAEQTQEIW